MSRAGPGEAPLARTACRASARNADRLGLEVLLEALYAVLASEAALLVAAERRVGGEPLPAVHRQSTGTDAPCDRHRALERRAVDGARQPVARVVGDAH